VRPDIAFVDIGLPDSMGYEIARRVRMELMDESMALVAITGYGQPVDRRRALAAGFDRHLDQPIDLKKLEEVTGPSGARRARADGGDLPDRVAQID